MGRRSRGEKGRARGILRSIRRRIARDRMGLAVIVMLTVLSVLLCYIGVYAKVTKNGYHRAHLVAQLRDARGENVRLRADIQALSSPERLQQVAMQSGMQACSQFDYLDTGHGPMVVAEAGQE